MNTIELFKNVETKRYLEFMKRVGPILDEMRRAVREDVMNVARYDEAAGRLNAMFDAYGYVWVNHSLCYKRS